MSKAILIIGAGKGISLSVAEKFGNEGYTIGLISRTEASNLNLKQQLSRKNIKAFSAEADAGNKEQLARAIALIKKDVGEVTVLFYNAAVMKRKEILLEDASTLADDFKVNVGGALDSVNILLSDLKATQGTVIFTGGGLANYPNPLVGSLSIGKAGIRNLALQLHQQLKAYNIFAGTLTINNGVSPESATHTPSLAAEKVWELAERRGDVEVVW